MDYSKLLTSATLKVLEVFKKEKLYLNQIAELTKMKSRSNLISTLRKLVKGNILKEEKTKGNTFYSLNYDNRITLTLLQLLCTSKLYNLPFEYRKAIEEIEKSNFSHIIFLFGSVAKNTFTKESDLDLLLIYNDSGDMRAAQTAKGIGKKYGITVNPTLISLAELRRPSDSLKHILQTGYPVFGYIQFYDIYKQI
ncbi:MAG: nucleotidyltransferase domain-containing protein [Nanoarchaeota archaeon]|nr:nucleotidyltransferase domain-containing protein [Nanoarchaeota archaeon]